LILIGLKLLSNKVIAKICCSLKFCATMAFHFVEADEEFMEETQVRTKTQKKVRTTGLKFSNYGQRRKEKMSNLTATKYQRSTKPSIILPLM